MNLLTNGLPIVLNDYLWGVMVFGNSEPVLDERLRCGQIPVEPNELLNQTPL